MAADLRKIAMENFPLIDKIYGPGARMSSSASVAAPARQRRRGFHVPIDEMEEPAAITSQELALRYGGLIMINYPKKTKGTRSGRPIKP